jgi:CDP-glucose 4,6-dehydratase
MNGNKKFKENDPLGGQDPYSSSKACTEIIAEAYFKSYYEKTKTKVITCRAGNVIGGGDWSEYRLFPDIIKSISQKKNISLRMPYATRPWQFVLEPLLGYLKSAELSYKEKINTFESFNFGPNNKINKNVLWIANRIYKNFNVVFSSRTKKQPFKESVYLNLSNQKAKSKLRWSPKLTIEKAIDWTCEGYKNFDDPKKFILTIESQINEYSK